MKSAALALCLVALGAPAIARQSASPPPAAPQASRAHSEAEAAERLALAREFAAATMGEDQVFEEFKHASSAGLEASLAQQGAEPAHIALAKEALEEVLGESEAVVRRRAVSMSAAYARVYASEFTAPELREMIAFAHTAGGRRYLTLADTLDLHPEIAEESDALTAELTPIVSAMQTRLCKRLAAVREAEGQRTKCPRA